MTSTIQKKDERENISGNVEMDEVIIHKSI